MIADEATCMSALGAVRFVLHLGPLSPLVYFFVLTLLLADQALRYFVEPMVL